MATSRVAVKVNEKMFKTFFKSYTLTIKTLLSTQRTYKVRKHFIKNVVVIVL